MAFLVYSPTSAYSPDRPRRTAVARSLRALTIGGLVVPMDLPEGVFVHLLWLRFRKKTIPAYDSPTTMKTIEGLTTEEERAAAIFRALGNPARIRIVTELARRNV